MKKFIIFIFAVVMAIFTINAKTVVFDFANNDYDLERKSGNASDGYLEEGKTLVIDDITLTFNGSWRLWTDGLRAYSKTASAQFTVSSTNNITNIVLEGNSIKYTVDEQEMKEWAGNSNSITFVSIAAGNYALTTVTITYDEEDTEDDPITYTKIPITYSDTLGIAHEEFLNLCIPEPEILENCTFLKWVIIGGDLMDGIQIKAIYEVNEGEDIPTELTPLTSYEYNGVKYNILGHPVSNNYKGIYIYNKRKYLQK